MATTGGEAIGQVLYRGEDATAFLERALAEVGGMPSVSPVLGIATTVPIATWHTAVGTDWGDASVILLDTIGGTDTEKTANEAEGIDVRDYTGSSLGDLGTAVLDLISTPDAERPAVIVDSVAALAGDPGKRFKFLTILGQRIARDDGILLAFEGPSGLPDVEVHTIEQLFDSVKAVD